MLLGLLTPSGVVLGLSESALGVLGIRDSGAVGKAIERVAWPPPLERLPQHVASMLVEARSGRASRREWSYTSPDHSPHRVEIELLPVNGSTGSITHFALSAVDTPRDREAEHELSRFFAHSTDLMAIADADLRLVRVNASWERVLAWTAGELHGMALPELVHPDDRDTVIASLQRLGRDSAHEDFEARLRRKGGDYRPIAFVARGAERRIHAVGRDVTERRSMMQNLSRLQRMEAIGEMAGGVAHDLNNALMAVLGFGELALARLGDQDVMREDLELMVAGARRAQTVIGQLLAFARRQPVEPRPVDLNDTCRNLELLLRPILGARVAVTLDLAGESCLVLVDPAQLDQMILNLATNARDAMPNGGQFTLRTRRTPRPWGDEAGAPGPPAAGSVGLIVEDTGIGMDDEVMARMFEPFFTTKGHDRGSGLGLPMVYGAITQAGGSVWVESAPGRGTRFELNFPWPAEASDQATVPRSGPGRRRPHVVLVEGDGSLQILIAKVLEPAHFRVLTAVTASEAIASAESAPGRPDLWIVDAATVDDEAMRRVEDAAAAGPGRPLLLLVDAAVPAPGEVGVRRSLLAKPFTPQQLLWCVEQLLAS
jgi:PAS domain S-box-containing protein